MIEKKLNKDRRTALRELSSLKKTIQKNQGRLPGNAKRNKAGGARLLKEAIADKEKRESDSKKRIHDWSMAEAGSVMKKMKCAISICPGIDPTWERRYNLINWGKKNDSSRNQRRNNS